MTVFFLHLRTHLFTKIMGFKRSLAFLCVVLVGMASAFAPICAPASSQTSAAGAPSQVRVPQQQRSGSTLLQERRWNFNEGRGPWGMKKNAEIWNGRLAQMGFTIVLLQEFVTGKGVIQGLQDGNIINIFFLGIAVASTVGLSVFLAFKGKENDIVY